MPLIIKKFNLNFTQIPEVFSLPRDLYVSAKGDEISQESLVQTPAQKKIRAEMVAQIQLDLPRTAYVDFTGKKLSALKSDWLIANEQGNSDVAKGLYPFYTQGNLTGAVVSELIQSLQVALPLSEKDPIAFQELKTSRMCFAYKNSFGEPSGFSIVYSLDGDSKGQHKGWIITTIQNTTARPEDRKVTVLGTPNYISNKAHSIISLETPTILEPELKAAINNDKVFDLVKNIFNANGSLNPKYLSELQTRITSNGNVDNRNIKSAQLRVLLQWTATVNNIAVNEHIAYLKEQIAKDIHFFKNDVFKTHLDHLLSPLAKKLSGNSGEAKSTNEITSIIEKLSFTIAGLKQLSENTYLSVEKSNTYQALAQKLQADALAIRFDGTPEDEQQIAKLIEINPEQVEQKVEKYYINDPAVRTYFTNKSKANAQMEHELAQLSKPMEDFFARNIKNIGVGGLVGLAVGTMVALVLITVAPILALLIGLAVGLAVAGVVSEVGISKTEEKHNQDVADYSNQVNKIRTNYKDQFVKNEASLQKGINLSSFLEVKDPIIPKPEFLSQVKVSNKKPLTPDRVANALWLSDKDSESTKLSKNRFSLWASKQKNLGFGLKEVEEILDKKYEMKPKSEG